MVLFDRTSTPLLLEMYTQLIKSLLQLVTTIEWYGIRISSHYGRLGCDGLITTFRTFHKGLEIRISKYEYVQTESARTSAEKDPRYKPEESITYFVLYISDPSARFGRKLPVNNVSFENTASEWTLLCSLFDSLTTGHGITSVSDVTRLEKPLVIKKLSALLKN